MATERERIRLVLEPLPWPVPAAVRLRKALKLLGRCLAFNV
jgi:hypothetical protein